MHASLCSCSSFYKILYLFSDPFVSKKFQIKSYFSEAVAGRCSATLLKTRPWHRCFPVNFAKFLRTPFLTEHLVAASNFYVYLGFGINGDLKILMGMFLYVKDYVLSARHLVDLCDVSQKVSYYCVTNDVCFVNDVRASK